MKRKTLFSNGTDFMAWQSENCERCVKASRYNPKTDTYSKYRCAVQRNIEMALVTDGMGDERTYQATHSLICPYLMTERKANRKDREVNEQLTFDF